MRKVFTEGTSGPDLDELVGFGANVNNVNDGVDEVGVVV